MTAARWQPIETAPKDGTDILVWDGRVMFVVDWDEGRWFDGLDDFERHPTHWMPLPDPPKE